MIAPAIPENENKRLQELYNFELLDTVYEKEFDEIVQLASTICNVSISLITLVDFDRQWFKANIGLDAKETERNISFCGHAILNDGLFVVNNALEDYRFFDNPLVTGSPNIRFYAGMPLTTLSGYKLGTLCVIDNKSKNLNKEQVFALQVLSRQVMKLFELRVRTKELQQVTETQKKIMTIMAHDIRGPLQSILNIYELNKEALLSENEKHEMDTLVRGQLDSTISLLNNIVDFGNLQLTNNPQLNEKTNLYNLCTECFGYFALAAKHKNNQLINLIKPNFEILTIKEGLNFVIRNLLGNANKFTSNGIITVDAKKHENLVTIIVTDSGIGMSKKVQESILNSSWSSYALGTNNEKGSGTGLKLVIEYLRKIDGNLKLESKEGEGTQVYVSIPQNITLILNS